MAGIGSGAKEKAKILARVPYVKVLPCWKMPKEPGLNMFKGRGGEGDQGDKDALLGFEIKASSSQRKHENRIKDLEDGEFTESGSKVIGARPQNPPLGLN